MTTPKLKTTAAAFKGTATGLGADLRNFLVKGNVIALAVGVTVGVAFTEVVNSFTDNILMQVIAAFGSQPDFAALEIRIGDGVIKYGAFLNSIVSFLIIGVTMFFVVKVTSRLFKEKEEESEPSDEVKLLTEIRDELRGRS